PAFGYVDHLRLLRFAIEDQRDRALCSGRIESSYRCLNTNALGIVDTLRRDHILHRPIRGGAANGVQTQRSVRIQAQVDEAGWQRGLLKIAEQMRFYRHLGVFVERSKVARELAERRPAVAWLDS